MSACYRIDVEHKPGNETYRYFASVIRLSDGLHVAVEGGHSAAEALSLAQAWVVAQSAQEDTRTVFVDEAGVIVEGHSERV